MYVLYLIVEFEKVVVDVHVVPFEPSYHLKFKFSVKLIQYIIKESYHHDEIHHLV